MGEWFPGKFAVLVRIHGPDPKGRKKRHQAFYSADSGDTALSASGVLLSGQSRGPLVLTCAAILEPFLSSKPGHDPQFISGAELEVLMQADRQAKPFWVPAELLALVDVPLASKDLKTLLDAQGRTGDNFWELGWNLGQVDGSPQLNALVGDSVKHTDDGVWKARGKEIAIEGLLKTSFDIAASATRMAILRLKLSEVSADYSNLILSKACRSGDSITVMGSPFGALSPLHFFNSLSVGIVSNSWPPSSGSSSLLMADIRCLPGMEGGPIFDRCDRFVGVLLRPLRQRKSGAEVQLVLTATSVNDALEKAGISLPWSMNGGRFDDGSPGGSILSNPCLNQYVSTAVDQAIESVVLITVDAGVWASGIILNRSGLVLTNAHLLEPWRFGKPRPNYRDPTSLGFREASTQQLMRPSQDIKVRVDSCSWHQAHVVFVSQGPLDIALLQLDTAPSDLRPIVTEPRDPVPGSTAIVVGHGMFGPRSELRPSVAVGVVSKLLKAKHILDGKGVSVITNCEPEQPLMLQTTAAVHPGASGGVVLDSSGHMIGLVTSNARHSDGTVIPHLNFSAPCACLEPILSFATTDMRDLSLLEELNSENEHISAVWAIVPPVPSKTPLDLDGKGSQFAKFIADKKKLLLDQSSRGFPIRSCL